MCPGALVLITDIMNIKTKLVITDWETEVPQINGQLWVTKEGMENRKMITRGEIFVIYCNLNIITVQGVWCSTWKSNVESIFFRLVLHWLFSLRFSFHALYKPELSLCDFWIEGFWHANNKEF